MTLKKHLRKISFRSHPLHGAVIKGHEDPLENVMMEFCRHRSKAQPHPLTENQCQPPQRSFVCVAYWKFHNPLLENILLRRVERAEKVVIHQVGWMVDILRAGEDTAAQSWWVHANLLLLVSSDIWRNQIISSSNLFSRTTSVLDIGKYNLSRERSGNVLICQRWAVTP